MKITWKDDADQGNKNEVFLSESSQHGSLSGETSILEREQAKVLARNEGKKMVGVEGGMIRHVYTLPESVEARKTDTGEDGSRLCVVDKFISGEHKQMEQVMEML